MADVTYALVRRNPQGGRLTSQAHRLEVSTAVTHPWRWLPLTGTGILAGQFPDGLTTIEGEPTTATVRILYRPEPGAPGDGVVVAEVQSNQDGTWLVEGLNPELKFDVVGRKRGFNDVIMANVSPYSSEYIQLDGGFTVVKPERNALEGRITVTGGTAPYTVDVVAGAAPAGIAFSYFYGAVEAAGTTEEWGDFEFTLRVTDANGVWAETQVELLSVDGQWDKVVSLLHFDGLDGNQIIEDEKGGLWSRRGTAAISKEIPGVFSDSCLRCVAGSGIHKTMPVIGTQDFCLEFWVYPTGVGDLWGRLVEFGPRSSGSLVFNNYQTAFPPRLMGQVNNYTTDFLIPGPSTQLESFAWNYVALTRESNTYRVFIGGTKVSEVNTSAGSNLDRSSPVSINTNNSGRESFQAFYDEFRLTVGVARYTEDFTPPKAPF